MKGFAKKYRIDYDEVFSLVATLESIRILIAIAAQVNWELHHLDVKTSFLNVEIDEDIYIIQLEGFLIKGKEDYALKLQKALHGLKHASRARNSKLNEVLIQMGFVRSKNDYTSSEEEKPEKEEKLIIGVYVDDLIITRSNSHRILEFKKVITLYSH